MSYEFLTKEQIPFSQIYYYISETTGKKTPVYEANNLTVKELAERNQREGYIWVKTKNGGFGVDLKEKPRNVFVKGGRKPLTASEYDSLTLAYSIYIKHAEDVYVIDIDDESITSMKDFVKLLKKLGDEFKPFIEMMKKAVWIKGNTKGIHIYVKINNIPHSKNLIDCFDWIKGDLLKTNNVWEKVGKEIHNYNGSLTEIEYDDIAFIFKKPEEQLNKAKKEGVERKEGKEGEYFSNTFKMDREVSDEEIMKVIDCYPKDYFANYTNWLILTNVMKFHNKFELWDQICKGFDGYNYDGNVRTWNSLTNVFIDINFLIIRALIMKPNADISCIDRYKEIDRVDINQADGEKLLGREQYLSNLINYRTFCLNDAIAIESGCGTGKTYVVNKLVKQYLTDQPKTKFLSLVNKISLAEQHTKSFKNVKLVSYQDKKKDIMRDNLVICVNSLMILSEIDDFSKYVVYIDEITDFVKSLTGSATMVFTIREIFTTLLRIIKTCKKLIVSDNELSNSAMELFGLKTDVKRLVVKNTFKKFEGVEAIRVMNEYEFIEKMKRHKKANETFICSSDSKTAVREIHAKLGVDDNTKIYVGGDGKDVETDDYEGNHIFYSPRISTGVDFNAAEAVSYVYIKGKSIDSELIYQQLNRNRQIKKVYYYCNDVESQKPEYESLEDCKDYWKTLVNVNNRIFERMCVNQEVGEDDTFECKVVENTFFKLFVMNTYNRDCYFTNIRIHFENILKQNGFVLSEEGKFKTRSKEDKEYSRYLVCEIDNKEFSEFLNGDENPAVERKMEYLNLPIEEAEQFKEILKDEHKYQNHIRIKKLFYNREYVEERVKQLKNRSFGVMDVKNIYNKLLYLWEFEDKYNIPFLGDDFYPDETAIEVSDEEWKTLKLIFRSEIEKKPETRYHMIQFYIQALKNIVGENVYESFKTTFKGVSYRYYVLNRDKLQHHLELARYRDDETYFNEFALEYI